MATIRLTGSLLPITGTRQAVAQRLFRRRRRSGLPDALPSSTFQLASPVDSIYDDLRAGLADEPCVIERDQDVAALLEDPRKLRKGMGPR